MSNFLKIIKERSGLIIGFGMIYTVVLLWIMIGTGIKI